MSSNKHPLQMGETVYHRNVYNHCEALKVVGINETQVHLEGDYSGGTNNVVGRDWLPIKGVSRIYNHAYKEKCRREAEAFTILASPINRNDPKLDNLHKSAFDFEHMVMLLTTDVELNPEF